MSSSPKVDFKLLANLGVLTTTNQKSWFSSAEDVAKLNDCWDYLDGKPDPVAEEEIADATVSETRMWKREFEAKLKKWEVSKIMVKLMLEECVGEEVKGMLLTKTGLEGCTELKNAFQKKDHIESAFKLKCLV